MSIKLGDTAAEKLGPPPATSRYAVVRQSGRLSRHGTKVASEKITIDAELRLPEIVTAAVKWVFDRAKWSEGAKASGYGGAATASGNGGAATASGKRSVAISTGFRARARACAGGAICLIRRNDNGSIAAIRATKIGENGTKPDTFYRLGDDDEFEEAS